jgi:hypothetical protein
MAAQEAIGQPQYLKFTPGQAILQITNLQGKDDLLLGEHMEAHASCSSSGFNFVKRTHPDIHRWNRPQFAKKKFARQFAKKKFAAQFAKKEFAPQFAKRESHHNSLKRNSARQFAKKKSATALPSGPPRAGNSVFTNRDMQSREREQARRIERPREPQRS